MISVGLGEVAATRADMPEQLVAHGVGSCIAVCLFDPISRVAGLAHVVLPGSDPTNRPNARFAGTALPALLDALGKMGGAREARRYQARLAGGAHVLATGGRSRTIGDQNLDAVRSALAAAAIPILASDVGGDCGRTVWFDPRDEGKIRVRRVGGAEVVL